MRTVAVALCQRGDALLVEEGRDRLSGERFHRAIGGGVEPGESAAAAVVREWREEFGLDLTVMRLLGTLDNRFVHEGRPGRERLVVFLGALPDEAAIPGPGGALYGTDPDGRSHVARWVPRSALADGPVPLLPRGLVALLP